MDANGRTTGTTGSERIEEAQRYLEEARAAQRGRKCPSCYGGGRVSNVFGKRVPCPRCKGSGVWRP